MTPLRCSQEYENRGAKITRSVHLCTLAVGWPRSGYKKFVLCEKKIWTEATPIINYVILSVASYAHILMAVANAHADVEEKRP